MFRSNCSSPQCLWAQQKPFCEMLNNVGVPVDNKWPALIVQLRGVSEDGSLSIKQKTELQNLFLALMLKKNFSDDTYITVRKKITAILSAPLEKKLKQTIKEVCAITQDAQNLLGEQKQDVISVAYSLDADIAAGLEPSIALASLRKALTKVISKMENDIKLFKSLSYKDSLTGLANRRSVDDYLAKSITLWEESRVNCCLILFDIDDFKSFNDSYGHTLGDEVLKEISLRVKKVISSFFWENDTVLSARFGGDEFAVIIRYLDEKECLSLGKKIYASIVNFLMYPKDINDETIPKGLQLSISMGVAFLRAEWQGSYVENLLYFADKALYFSKKKGKSLISVEDSHHVDGFYLLQDD